MNEKRLRWKIFFARITLQPPTRTHISEAQNNSQKQTRKTEESFMTLLRRSQLCVLD
jgi:hypothetical protein